MECMSSEEVKIRSELEMDVERDLEEEIKDGIYHLALRLHRLYQHQKEKSDGARGTSHDLGITKNKTLSEVNINIRMEGGTKIEIKEIKKVAHDRPRTTYSRSDNMQEIVTPNRRKFDWASSLRSGTSLSKKIDSPHQVKMLKKDVGVNENVKADGLGRKGNIGIKISEQRELGWRE